MTIALYTVGHSTRAIDEFLAMLHGHSIETLVDVRTVPRSRRNPQFSRDELRLSLAAAPAIEYVHMKSLGGLRRPAPDSINMGWQNASFRGYADYMQTAEFRRALDELIALAGTRRTVIMCAEAVPWRCHRSLVGDALRVRAIDVTHIIGPRHSRPHELTAFAEVDGTHVTYPPVQTRLPL